MGFHLKDVTITGGFWKAMQDKNRDMTIAAVYDRFAETGRFEAMKCRWKEGMENRPHFFWDSDVAKWMEGAAYVLAKHRDDELEQKVESIIDDIEKNQDENGYYNVYYTVVEPENRFQSRLNHELYCAGHLIEAAVAYYEATGKKRFLKLMQKYADYIYTVFAEEKSAGFVTPGHEEIELALLRLYRCVGDKKYLRLCEFFIESRGRQEEENYEWVKPAYAQNEMPVRELTQADGHAVRAMYLYTAMADLAFENKDTELLDVCRTLFYDVVDKKMCITGGIGAAHIGESFTVPYDLAQETAYNETCASIGMAFFADKLLENEICSVYADAIERELYNGIISGLSLDGTAFFYENPLEICLRNQSRNVSTYDRDRLPVTQRKKMFDCSCCPPNINRVFASVEKYIYGKKDGVYYVHQYMDSILEDGACRIEQKTEYPTDGEIRISCRDVETIALRIPGWCDTFSLSADYRMENGYAYISKPQNITLRFEMKPKLYMANCEVNACSNKTALMLGPVVYCIEEVDHGTNIHNLYLDKKTGYEIRFRAEYGMNEITAKGYRRLGGNGLYLALSENYEDFPIKFIPYYAFANRGESDMLVWINYR